MTLYKYFLGGLILLVLIGLVPVMPVQAARKDFTLTIKPVRVLQSGSELCAGEMQNFTFRAILGRKSIPKLKYGLAGVTVSLEDGQTTIGSPSSRGGNATFSRSFDTQGSVTLRVTATYGNISAPALVYRYKVVNCDNWSLGIIFMEKYEVIANSGWNVYAEAQFFDTVSLNNQFSNTTRHEGTYKAENRQYTDPNMPLYFGFNQTTSGEFDIKWKAYRMNNQIILELMTTQINFPPPGLDWDWALLSEYQAFKNLNPPIPLAYTNGRFLEINRLTRLSFPEQGDTITRRSGEPCFFNSPPANLYFLEISLSKITP